MELLDPSELLENTDRCGGLSYNVVKWPVCRSVMVQCVVVKWPVCPSVMVQCVVLHSSA
jgi:hypothetical protein